MQTNLPWRAVPRTELEISGERVIADSTGECVATAHYDEDAELIVNVVNSESSGDVWLRLAHQYDGHRMQALGLLKSLASDTGLVQLMRPDQQQRLADFLSERPISGREITLNALRYTAWRDCVLTGDTVFGNKMVDALPDHTPTAAEWDHAIDVARGAA